MSNNSQALKSGVWYTIANFLMRSIGLITTPIFTRLMSHQDFGLYSNFTSWMSILTIIITLNLESTFISAKFDFKDDFNQYTSSVLVLSSCSCLFAILLLNSLFGVLQPLLGMSRVYLNAMLLYLFFMPAINIYQAREQFFFRYKTSVFLSLLVSFGTAALSVLLVSVLDNKLAGRIFGSVLPSILIGIVLYGMIWRSGREVNPAYWKYAIRICLPYIPHLLSMTVLNSVDRIMITNICGAEDNALYSLAYSCGSLVSILIVSMNTAFSPWLGEKLNQKEYPEINRFSKIYISAFLILAVTILLFSPEVLLILGGKSYLQAVYVMPPIACGCICQFLYTMFVNVEQFSKKTVGMAVASMSAALFNYVLNMIFIPMYGYVAAAYTTLAGFLWLLGVHMYLVYRYGLKRVYPYRFIGMVVALALCITIGINFLYYHTGVRYAVGIIYILALVLFVIRRKDMILDTVKRIRNEDGKDRTCST